VNGVERRAARLVRCYPARWRERYGEEFIQLLIDDIEDRPRSLRRAANVIRCGLTVRVRDAGPGWALAAFIACGVGIWSQLTIGWQWSAPAASATRAGMLLMTGAIVVLAAIGALALIPLAVSVRGARAAARPLILTAVGTVVFTVGCVHFGHGWPGTGGHRWADRGLVPSAVAQFCWAGTLWITSYWAHPGALAAFPASELAWMLVSPLALAAMLIGATRTLRRVHRSPRLLAYNRQLGTVAVAAMAVFLAGAGSWVVSGSAAPRGLFRVGAIDDLGLAVMAAALIVASRFLRRAPWALG
jgi:hypothetical protein